jgi:Zn-dependent peptidase ImmA (M78 family)
MRKVLAKLTRWGWNRRPLTEADFFTICDAEVVRVIELPLPQRGLYLVRHGMPVIALDEGLRGTERLFIQWHELGHHFLHTPDSCHFSLSLTDKIQFQANVIASCALIPQTIIRACEFDVIAEEFEVSRDIITMRAQVWQRLKL